MGWPATPACPRLLSHPLEFKTRHVHCEDPRVTLFSVETYLDLPTSPALMRDIDRAKDLWFFRLCRG
jgi:hypothetical protein